MAWNNIQNKESMSSVRDKLNTLGSSNDTEDIIIIPAKTSILKYKVLVSDNGEARYATFDDDLDVLGISINDCNISENVNCKYRGTIEDSSFNFSSGLNIYMDANSELTQDISQLVDIICVGIAITTTKMLVRINSTIINN